MNLCSGFKFVGWSFKRDCRFIFYLRVRACPIDCNNIIFSRIDNK